MFDLGLLIAKFAFLVLLYIFIFWTVRVIAADTAGVSRTPESGPALTIQVLGGASFRLVEPALIGRSGECDIHLDDAAASARHARLLRKGRKWLLEDLKSSNGTFINEERVRGRHNLAVGDRIKIGRTEMKVETA